jgi:cytokinin dehydrogenase
LDSVLKYFDKATMGWRANRTASSISVPTLDGQLSTNLSDRKASSTDWGHIVCEPPSAVLYPASIEDIVKMVRFCSSLGVTIGARGQAHTMYGQSQVRKGVIIHMSALNSIDSIESDHAIVEAGVIWRDLLAATLARGLTPPVLTDYLSLSIGGTLSVGGVNGTSYKHGAQVDNALYLDVVTGTGDLVTCSLERHRDLFESTLAGLGQCAIIVRANVKLIPAPRFIRVFDMAHQDLDSLLVDFQTVLADERFNYIQGIVSASATKDRPKYILEGVSFYDETPPDNDTILSNLLVASRNIQTTEDTYFRFCDRVSEKEASLRERNRWNLPHPWFDMFIPASQAAAYIGTILSRLGCNDHPDFANLLYGFRKRALTRPLLRVPEEEVFFLFNVARTTRPDQSSEAVAQNRQFYDEGCVKGGVCYPIGAIAMSRDDWKSHFGLQHELLLRSKVRYDPNRLLTPGPQMFD